MVAFNNDYIEPLTVNNLEIRLAKNEKEVLACQKLRYEHFIKEYIEEGSKGDNNNGVNPTDSESARLGIDKDQFDDYCAHLIIIDKNLGEDPEKNIIATYRLMRKEQAKMIGRFYSETEFNIDKIKDMDCEILELGRATVHRDYRNNITLKLLWEGIAEFVYTYNIKYMFGTASFHGVNEKEYSEELAFIYHYCKMPKDLMAYAFTEDARKMDLIDKDKLDTKKTLLKLPTVIKGYLRTGGCTFADTAFIDFPFGCIDVFVFFDTSKVNDKYLKLFSKLDKS